MFPKVAFSNVRIEKAYRSYKVCLKSSCNTRIHSLQKSRSETSLTQCYISKINSTFPQIE